MTEYDIAKRKKELKGQINYAEQQLKSNLVGTFDESPSIRDFKKLVPLGIHIAPLVPFIFKKCQSSGKSQSNKEASIPWMQLSTILVQMFLKYRNSADKTSSQ